MNSRVLKIIAVVAMTIDHVGKILFPEFIWMRIIGRIAFPLFAFLIAYGATKTRNIQRYALRLFIFAILTQVALSLVLWEIHWRWLNVFFTLAGGVLVIILIRKIATERNVIAIIAVLFIFMFLLTAQLLNFDYGAMGVLLITMFYVSLVHSSKTFKIACLPILIIFNIPFLFSGNVQIYSLVSVVFLLLFVDKKITMPKWERIAFYIFYPLHLVILHLIAIL